MSLIHGSTGRPPFCEPSGPGRSVRIFEFPQSFPAARAKESYLGTPEGIQRVLASKNAGKLSSLKLAWGDIAVHLPENFSLKDDQLLLSTTLTLSDGKKQQWSLCLAHGMPSPLPKMAFSPEGDVIFRLREGSYALVGDGLPLHRATHSPHIFEGLIERAQAGKFMQIDVVILDPYFATLPPLAGVETIFPKGPFIGPGAFSMAGGKLSINYTTKPDAQLPVVVQDHHE